MTIFIIVKPTGTKTTKRKEMAHATSVSFWLIPSPRYLPKSRSKACYWRATYLAMLAQLAEVSAVVKATGGVVAFILTTASVLEQ